MRPDRQQPLAGGVAPPSPSPDSPRRVRPQPKEALAEIDSANGEPRDDEAKKPNADQGEKTDAGKAEAVDEKKQAVAPGRKRLFIVLGVCALVLIAVGGTLYWLHARHYEDTDDAFIDADQSQVGSQVAGRVEQILVADNQHVDSGQVLLLLDPRDYQVKLEQSRAAAKSALAQARGARADLVQQRANRLEQEAQVKVAQADLEKARRDLARYQAIDPAAITRQQIDQAVATVDSDTAKLDSARDSVRAAQALIGSQDAKIAAADAAAAESEADVRNAELQLSYTQITAPQAGRVTRRTVNLGNFVQPGQALLAIVPDRMWVTANFKETQLKLMRVGQPVRITVDAYPSHPFAGHIDSMQRGTGAVFSSIPVENATGNYVKVVQRVPVKIVFDGDDWQKLPLAPGMSVSPRVTVR